MIVALGSLQREATGIIRAGEYAQVDAPDDFTAYRPESDEYPAVVLSGTGVERAARATKWAIDEFSPDAIVSFGFCGATKENIFAGDIVIAARLINLPGTPFEWSIVDDTDSLGPDRTLLLAARTAVEISALDYHLGTIVTLEKIATTRGTKRWLGDAMNATAVDTEAHAVASVASDNKIPWVAVSSVLGDRDFDVPKIVDRVGSGPDGHGLTAYIKHLSNTPLDLPPLMRLARSATVASSSLTTFMASFMEARSSLAPVEQASE